MKKIIAIVLIALVVLGYFNYQKNAYTPFVSKEGDKISVMFPKSDRTPTFNYENGEYKMFCMFPYDRAKGCNIVITLDNGSVIEKNKTCNDELLMIGYDSYRTGMASFTKEEIILLRQSDIDKISIGFDNFNIAGSTVKLINELEKNII